MYQVLLLVRFTGVGDTDMMDGIPTSPTSAVSGRWITAHPALHAGIGKRVTRVFSLFLFTFFLTVN